MENRRPPRPGSSGQKPYFDRSRGAPYRGGTGSGDGRGKGPKRFDRPGDGRYQDRTQRTDDRSRDGYRGGGPRHNDGNRTGRDRFDGRGGDNRQRQPGGSKRPAFDTDSIQITSDFQITDGRLKGKELQISPSPHAVPTKRKLREVVFKVVSRRVKAARFLDLGAGCGTIGLEAISRGAMLVTFVERSARMCALLRKNLAELGVKDGHGELHEAEILPFLMKAAGRRRLWDVAYLHLPRGDEQSAIIDHFSRGSGVKVGGLLLIEHSSDETYPDMLKKLRKWRTINQQETILTIYERM